MRADDKKTRTLEEVTHTRLLTCWNMPHAQANLWFLGGIGALQGEDKQTGNAQKFDKIMLTPSVHFDYENTRLYLAATHRLFVQQILTTIIALYELAFHFMKPHTIKPNFGLF